MQVKKLCVISSFFFVFKDLDFPDVDRKKSLNLKIQLKKLCVISTFFFVFKDHDFPAENSKKA